MSAEQGDEGIRLAKRVAGIVPCSRADAERYIAGGWVSVDGNLADDPAARVRPEQDVTLLPGAEPVEPAPVTILLHKPAGIDMIDALALVKGETQLDAGQGVRFLRRYLARQEAMLPLEIDASGLVVFTQDWRVARSLTQDADRIEQEYVVEVRGAIADDGLARLNAPLRLDGRVTTAVKASWQSEARLRLAGKNMRRGQAAAMCVAVGLEPTAMRRLRIGRVALGALPVGRWRLLHEAERF